MPLHCATVRLAVANAVFLALSVAATGTDIGTEPTVLCNRLVWN